MQATEAMTEQLWFVIQSMHKVWDRLNMDRFLGKQQAKEEAMKVQAKLLSDHYQYEVVEESSNYYIVYGTGGKVAVSKADYEPVQEWVDVTHECTLSKDGYGRYSLFHYGCAVEASNKRYKVTRNGCVTYKVEAQK
jgi:hypothetical protein